jgi:heterodisulfide reductase subunit B
MAQSQSDTVHVFDTWVRGTKGLLHFDVMTTDEATALKLAKQHLASLGEGAVPVTVKECQFCHTEPLVMFNSEQQRQFREQGGFIITLST